MEWREAAPVRQTPLTYVLAAYNRFELSDWFSPVGLHFSPSKRGRYPAEGQRQYWGGERRSRDGPEVGLPGFSFCDFFKGFVSVKLGLMIAGFFQVNPVFASVLAATASVIGHDYPVWLGFKGGKGIATLAGTVLSVFPPPVCVSFGIVWVVVFLLGRYTSLASICAVIALPIAAVCIAVKNEAGFQLLVGFCVFMAALALWRHRNNIVRLLNGTENRFGKK